MNGKATCTVGKSELYNMLMGDKGNVTVKIDGIAASAASVIAMAGRTGRVRGGLISGLEYSS